MCTGYGTGTVVQALVKVHVQGRWYSVSVQALVHVHVYRYMCTGYSAGTCVQVLVQE